VREATRQDDGVDPVEVVVRVPEGHGLGAGEAHGAGSVAVVERPGERDDADAGAGRCCCHQLASAPQTTSSMTGFDRNVYAAPSAAASTYGVTSPSTSSPKRLPWRAPTNWVKPSRGSAPTTALPCGSRISGLGMTSTTT